jgi:uroporphyrin-III C-methyltransferase
MPAGRVYVVGAGPGHADLLTLRAAALLRIADVVVYDRLIQPGVLELAAPSAERIFMGKRPGASASLQDDIHAVLLQKAREGKTVVRLKGGDPFMFGRGGEEAEFLAEHNVPFEVVPGVSAALAAPLRAGIPVTHRGVASAVAFVAGHEVNDEATRLDWAALARIPTLVFMMAVNNVRRIADRLIDHGRPASTPVTIIQSAFWDDERIVTSTLGAIADEVHRMSIQPPATLVVGEVVRLGRRLAGMGPSPGSEPQ